MMIESVDEFVIAIHHLPPLQTDDATIGFTMDLAMHASRQMTSMWMRGR